MFCFGFHITINGIFFSSKNIGEKKLISIPVNIERFIDGDLQFGLVIPAQIHEDLIFNTTGGIGGKFDIFLWIEGIDCFDQSNRADGDQVFYAHTGIVKFFRYIYNQTQVMFNKKLFSFFILPASEKGNGMTFFFTAKWERQDICPSYVMDFLLFREENTAERGNHFQFKTI